MGPDKWLMVSVFVAVILILIAFLALVLARKKKRAVDYYNLFVMGIIWLLIGIPFQNNPLMVMGVLFAIVGITHKKEWKKNRRTWKKMTNKERKVHIALVIALSILVIAALALLLARKKCIGY